MAYYRDLTPYEYSLYGKKLSALNIGWLEESVPFEKGVVSHDKIAVLDELCGQPVLIMRGVHCCDFCARGERACRTGEIRVLGEQGRVYAAPALLLHYVRDHNYLPPEEFLSALLSRPIADHLAEMRRWDEWDDWD